MKTLKCDLCDATAEGETFEDWMKALMPHYMEAHATEMSKKGEMTPEEQEASKKVWMDENKARFEAQS